MTYGATITAMLKADTTLMAILTGDVHDFTKEGRKGVSRVTFIQSFVVNQPVMKPLCIVYEADEVDTKELGITDRGFKVTRTPINLWMYCDGNSNYDAIDTAYNRIYTLLQQAPIAGGYQIIWQTCAKNKREELLNNAGFYSCTFIVHGYRTQ